MTARVGVIAILICACAAPERRAAVPAAAPPPADPLPAWNAGPAKRAIVAFVHRVTDPRSADFVPAEARVAVFDNDGTLWAEQPIYAQAAFLADLEGARGGLAASDVRGAVAQIIATLAGMTDDQLDARVTRWIATARNPATGRLYTDMTYEPMIELLAYLRANGFECFIVTGGGVEFVRAWAERAYGIARDRVIGSHLKLRYEVRGGRGELVHEPELEAIDDGPGKPVAIAQAIGRRPIFAFGNSDGDYEMLQYTTTGRGARLGLLLHHTDAAREWAYDRASTIGTLSRALDDARRNGWIVVDMRTDWKTVFANR